MIAFPTTATESRPVKRIILMGPPGVGKGTQSARLASELDVPALSTGELFRGHVRRETGLGLRVAALLAAGEYVPDSITNTMVAEWLAAPGARGGFILDGYPRTTAQVGELDRMLDATNQPLDAVVLLEADSSEVVDRLLRRAELEGRPDDNEEVIRRRIDVYKSETALLAEEYEQRGLLFRVDGLGSPDEVTARILVGMGVEKVAAAGSAGR